MTSWKVAVPECEFTVVDIVLVVDSSGSICNDEVVATCNNWEFVTGFLNRVVDALVIGADNAHVALIRFASRVDVILNLDRFVILLLWQRTLIPKATLYTNPSDNSFNSSRAWFTIYVRIVFRFNFYH